MTPDAQNATAPLSFWMEALCIFLGDVCAVAFIAIVTSIVWHLVNYPGFRVGANWSWTGWDMHRAGRLPNDSDSGPMQLWPNISVTSYDMSVRKVIAAVWVREKADPGDPGEVLGKLDLRQQGPSAENRTTGGDVLNLRGPTINCDASKFVRVCNFPIFIQTTDGDFYKALSPGNSGTKMLRLRLKTQEYVQRAKRSAQEWLG